MGVCACHGARGSSRRPHTPRTRAHAHSWHAHIHTRLLGFLEHRPGAFFLRSLSSHAMASSSGLRTTSFRDAASMKAPEGKQLVVEIKGYTDVTGHTEYIIKSNVGDHHFAAQHRFSAFIEVCRRPQPRRKAAGQNATHLTPAAHAARPPPPPRPPRRVRSCTRRSPRSAASSCCLPLFL